MRTWLSTFVDDQVTLLATKEGARSIVDEFQGRVSIEVLRLAPHGVCLMLEAPLRRRVRAADIVISHNFRVPGPTSAVFVHDMLPFSNPEWFTALERVYYRGIRWSARTADIVFTSSNSEAARIRELAPRRHRTTHATGLGLDPSLLHAVPREVPGLEPQTYLLSVGRLNARKNLARLVHALTAGGVIDDSRPLVVVGEAQGRTGNADFVDADQVRWLKSVSSSELRWLYENAIGFIYPSLGEGYGLPPLEARAFGCPIAASDLAVFRETLGDGALYFDPLDEDSIVTAADELKAGAGIRADPTAHRWTWESVVRSMRREISRRDSAQRRVELD